jgi:hypothetical protein
MLVTQDPSETMRLKTGRPTSGVTERPESVRIHRLLRFAHDASEKRLRFRDLAKRSTCHVQRSHEITRANRQETAIRFRVFDRPKRWPSRRPRRRTGATRSRIVEEISRLAFSNAADVFSIEGGQLVAKEHAHLDRDTLSTIASVEESVDERGHRTTKVRQHEPLPPSHCWRGSRTCRSISRNQRTRRRPCRGRSYGGPQRAH